MTLSIASAVYKRSNSLAFGAVLFGTIIVVTLADIFNSKKNYPWFGIGRLTKMIPTSLRGARSIDGNLIVRSGTEFGAGKWRQIVSHEGGGDEDECSKECELEVINELDEQILMCWVHPDGTLKHYHPINDRSIRDNSVSHHHIEFTQRGHAFVCLRSNCDPLPLRMEDVSENSFLFCYVPTTAQKRHILTIRSSDSNHQLRGSNRESGDIIVERSFLSFVECRGEVIDTTQKSYLCRTIEGFTVKYEPDVFETVAGFEEALIDDIKQLRRLMPTGACDKLAADTIIWVNTSITFGTTKRPVIGACATFHPLGGAEWLRKNGMHVEKEGCVELFSAASYMKSRGHWGLGGIMLHEFSHAYHNKCCEGRFDCEEIRQAYSNAMKDKRYDSVPVHGPQGEMGNAKAYACTNCMEFFAELSVAYFWTDDDETEFNKWYPYNRTQLKQHDPESFKVLHKYWSQFENVSNTTPNTKSSS